MKGIHEYLNQGTVCGCLHLPMDSITVYDLIIRFDYSEDEDGHEVVWENAKSIVEEYKTHVMTHFYSDADEDVPWGIYVAGDTKIPEILLERLRKCVTDGKCNVSVIEQSTKTIFPVYNHMDEDGDFNWYYKNPFVWVDTDKFYRM